MLYKERQTSFVCLLAKPVVTKITKIRLFAGPYLYFGDFLVACLFLYENGGILGRARRDNITELAKEFSLPRCEGEFVNGYYG